MTSETNISAQKPVVSALGVYVSRHRTCSERNRSSVDKYLGKLLALRRSLRLRIANEPAGGWRCAEHALHVLDPVTGEPKTCDRRDIRLDVSAPLHYAPSHLRTWCRMEAVASTQCDAQSMHELKTSRILGTGRRPDSMAHLQQITLSTFATRLKWQKNSVGSTEILSLGFIARIFGHEHMAVRCG